MTYCSILILDTLIIFTLSPPFSPGNTALMLACARGHLGVAEALLDAGAPLEAANHAGVRLLGVNGYLPVSIFILVLFSIGHGSG